MYSNYTVHLRHRFNPMAVHCSLALFDILASAFFPSKKKSNESVIYTAVPCVQQALNSANYDAWLRVIYNIHNRLNLISIFLYFCICFAASANFQYLLNFIWHCIPYTSIYILHQQKKIERIPTYCCTMSSNCDKCRQLSCPIILTIWYIDTDINFQSDFK
jgi:hypothetical protein